MARAAFLRAYAGSIPYIGDKLGNMVEHHKNDIIVAQTSAKHIGTRNEHDRPMRLKQGDYIRERVHAPDYDAFDIVANMYNGVYGKRARKKKIPLTPEHEEDVLRLADALNGFASDVQEFEADVALDEALRAVKKLPHAHEKDAAFTKAMFTRQEAHESLSRSSQEALKKAVEAFALTLGVQRADDLQELETLCASLLPLAREKEFKRNERKMAEVLELLEILEKEGVEHFHHLIDAAGGAGDLGIALAERYPHMDARIVDVVPALGDYVAYLSRNGLHKTTRDRVHFELSPLQNVEVHPAEAPDTALVAKHPCGGG